MKTTYYNRYGDNIIFEELNNTTVEMSGYNPEWLRVGFANDYTDAYELYLNQCRFLEEPDFDYLVEDVKNHECRPMSYQEFIYEVENNKQYLHYSKLVKADHNVYRMVDPSGGPYIAVGMNLGHYFNDKVVREVTEIKFLEKHKVIFTIDKQSKKH